MRYAARIDQNKKEIVEAFRERGASVYDLKLPVDLLVGYNNKTVLVEVKNLGTAYGRKGPNEYQQNFMDSWKGGAVFMATDVAGVETLMRMLEK